MESWPGNGSPTGQGRAGRDQDSLGRKKAHTIYSVPESVAERIHTRLAQQPLMTAARQNSQRGLGLAPERVFQDLRQPRLAFRDPARIVLAHGFLVVSEQVGDVRDGHAALQEYPCEGMPESVRRRGFLERSRDVEHLRESSSPDVGDGLKAVGSRDDERSVTVLLRSRLEAIAEPIGYEREHVPTVLLGANEHLLAVQALHAEQRRIGNPEAGVQHQPDQVLQVLARPDTQSGLVLPLNFHLVAGGDDALDLVVREGCFIRRLARTDRCLDIGADRRFRNPLAVDAKAEKPSQCGQALALRPRSQLPVRPEQVNVVGCDLIKEYVALAVGVRGDLLREGLILAKRSCRQIGGRSTSRSPVISTIRSRLTAPASAASRR